MSLLLTVLSYPVIVVAGMFSYITATTWYHQQPFNAEAWKVDKENRWTMTRDIINSRRLIGKQRTEILSLMGAEHNASQSKEWVYDIGNPPNVMDIDPSFLTIEFKEDTVANVSQHPE